MENLEVAIPQFWKGLPVRLSRIVTTDDNPYLNNGDFAAFIQILGDPSDFIKPGDLLCLETDSKGFEGHVFEYHVKVETKGVRHIFSPISQFLERDEIVIDDLSEVQIKGKLLCSFRGLSEGISFLDLGKEDIDD
ncbi:hypothetical protein D922_03372 [Enterococcus faecalis 06-MB-DW-09]|nr:hypothetical protein D922_03372 [Enterococcus faecalis 06-MB-DW-09]